MNYLKCLLAIVFMPILGYTQVNTDWGVPYNDETKSIIYEEVIVVEGASKDELYKRALNWVTSYYTAGESKIKEKSKEEGIIELKDRLLFFKMKKKSRITDVIIDYNMTIFLKDGKIKYQITNFRDFQGSTSPHIEQWMEARYSDPDIAKVRFEKLNEEIQKIIEALKNDIKKGDLKNDDDW